MTAHASDVAQPQPRLLPIWGNFKFTQRPLELGGHCRRKQPRGLGEAPFLGEGRGQRAGWRPWATHHLPGPQAPCPQPHEHGADQLPEGSGIHGVQLVLLAVPEVMVVQRTSGQTHAFGSFVIVQQPLQLDRETTPVSPQRGMQRAQRQPRASLC
jgi:hypothetical protein